MRVASTGQTNVVTRSQQAPDRGTADAIILIILTALALICYAPVLIWPHWGMFSDAAQIIQSGRQFWQNPAAHWDSIRGYWRPGFHIWDLLLWAVAPDKPLVFYLFRATFFVGTVLLTYKNSLMLSQSRLLSFFASAMWLSGAATYEVLYTLDKGEIYIAFCFGLLVQCYLQALNGSTSTGKRHWTLGWSAAAFVVCLYAMFTKETSQIVLVLVAAHTACSALCNFANKRKPFADQVSKLSLLFLALAVASYAAYKVYFYTTGGGNAAVYISLGFTAQSLLFNLQYYWRNLNDFYLMLLLCAVGSFAWARSILAPEQVALRFCISLTLTALAGALAFLCLPTWLIYVWFPLYALLLPACAFFVARLIKALPIDQRLAQCCVLGPLIVLALSVVPLRSYQAQYQFQLDALTQDLTAQLAKFGREHHLQGKQIILPFFNPGGAEIGERIEFYTFDKLYPNYVEAVPGQYPDAPFQLANIIGYDLPDADASTWLGVGRKGERLRGYKDFSLEPTKTDTASSLEAGAADDAYGLKAYSYWSDLGPPHLYHWRKHHIESGALFLIPFGDLPEKLAGYRGASMFTTDWKTQCMSIPQVHLQELLTVSKTIYLSKNRMKHMGWKLMEADPIPALGWNIEGDGWLKNPCRVYLGPSCQGKTLLLHSDWHEKTNLLVQEGAGAGFSVAADPTRTYSIPLKTLKDGFITLSTNNGTQHRDEARHLLLHLDRAEIK